MKPAEQVLFTHSYFLRFDPKQWALGQPYPPLGTLYAASLLRENGYTVSLLDTMFSESPDEIDTAIQLYRPKYVVICDDGFNYLTKMCLTNMREAAFTMIGKAKKAGCTVIVSSSDSTDHFDQYLSQGADYVVLGEPEQTLLALMQALSNGDVEMSRIQGLAFRKDEAIIRTGARPVMRNLDDLPFPAWDLLDIQPYRESWLRSVGYFSLNMGTTRGCPFKCNWCAKPIYGNRYNSRSPRHVVDELMYLKEQFQFDHIWFCDDIFGLKPGWVQEFSRILEEEELQFRFKIQCRADLLVQENYVKALAGAGCENVWMGAESGSQKILDAMDKGTTIEQIYAATRLLRKHGIHPSFFIQFGYPGETREDIRKTIRMINELLPFEIGISVSYPLPGTPFYERVKGELKEKANWSDSDELKLMFRNTFQPEFYKQLHRYVHKSYRKHLAIDNVKQLVRYPKTLRMHSFKKIASLAWYFPATLVAGWKLHLLEKPSI